MIHRVVWRVASREALDFWEQRLTDAGYDAARGDDSLIFSDFEGLTHELSIVQTTDEPLIANHPEIPAELALQGFDAVRAYAVDPDPSRALLEQTLNFERPAGRQLRGPGRAPRRLLHLRPGPGAAAVAGRRHRAPRRLGHPCAGARGLAAARRRIPARRTRRR